MSVLMGNIEDVADMSQRLLTALEGAVQGKGFEEQVIGTYISSEQVDQLIVF